jgi:hypothetical protein
MDTNFNQLASKLPEIQNCHVSQGYTIKMWILKFQFYQSAILYDLQWFDEIKVPQSIPE